MRFTATLSAAVLLLAVLSGCDSSKPPAATVPQPASTPAPQTTAMPSKPEPKSVPEPQSMFEDEPGSTEHGTATWYDVPQKSLAKRRAPDEFTAAHDRLPIGSYVRVTDEKSGRSVIVRITDRGLGKKHGIDLCKEAAEAIGLVSEGIAKVRIDVLRERAP